MASLGRQRSGWVSVWLGWVGWMVLPSLALAQARFVQFPQPVQRTPEQLLLDRLPREFQAQSEFNEADELLGQGEYDQAIEIFQLLLGGEDFFQVDQDKPAGSSLDRIEKRLWSMPTEGIEIYRKRYEPVAAQHLAEALARGNLAELLAIIRTYPLTLAARQATQSAGEIAFDQGETALAARIWQRLLLTTQAGEQRTALLLRISQAWTLAGQPEEAVEYARELSTLAQKSPLEFETKLLTPPENGDVAWLNKAFGPVPSLVPQLTRDWRMTGGHPRRWGSGLMVSPLSRGSWTVPLIDQYDVFVPGRNAVFQTFLKDLEKTYLPRERVEPGKTTPLVIGSPVVVGDIVLVQGVGAVKAFDARTGQTLWSGVVKDDTFLYWTQRNYEEKGANANHDRLVESYFGQRAWLNQTGAALASDGKNAYAITGTGMTGAFNRNMFMRGGGQGATHELSPPSYNRLLAYDIQTGLLKWESGGAITASQPDEFGQLADDSRRLNGAFFLGAPLPVDGQLFVLAEDRGQIRLYSLSPETGEAAWSLPLLNPAFGIAFEETRRMHGFSPAYAGGLLICPTGEGVVVAVDPLRRRMVWIQQYQSESQSLNPQQVMMMRLQRQQVANDGTLANQLRQRRWFDSTPVLTANRILLPATETNRLYGLEIETGKTVWEVPRGEGLFIAACTERHCLIAGERSIHAIRLSDGKVAWSREIPTPTGRGTVSGGQYLLPVLTNEILSIEMKSGAILARSKIDPAHSAGSLVAAGGQLLMQTTSELIGLRPMSDVTEELAQELKNPDTRARALAEHGELLLFKGREAEAVAALQESLTLKDSAATRRLLAWSLLERLKADYSANRGLVTELKQTITDPDQKKLLNRLNAEGLEKAGEPLAAFREYLELLREVDRGDRLLEVAPDHRVREDRWLRGRMTHLYTLVEEPLRQQMRTLLDESLASLDPAMKPLLASVLGIELTPQLHLQLALDSRFDQFISQRVLWTLSESNDPKLRGPAVARLIRNELAQKRDHFIQPLIAALQRDLAQFECEPGKTGQQILEELRADQQFGPMLALICQSPSLPKVESRVGGAWQNRETFPQLGTRRGPFADWSFSAEFNAAQNVFCCDGSGQNRHKLNLDMLGERVNRQLRYVQTDSQLVLLAFRERFVVVNPSDPGGFQLNVALKQSQNINGVNFNNQPLATETRVGVRDTLYPQRDGSFLGNVGPLTYDTLCYQVGSDLFAVLPHAKDGKIQWQRSSVPPGTEICADAGYVILIPPSQDRLIVLRAADGLQLAERPLPKGRVERRRAEWGRLFLVARTEKGDGTTPSQTTWAMYDPVTHREAWSLTLPAETKYAPVNGSDLAFLEPDGTLRLVDDQTGQQLWTATLPAQKVAPQLFTVLADTERLYVHTSRPWTPDQDLIKEQTQPANGSAVFVNGVVVALNRLDGKTLWSRPVEQQLLRPNLPVGSGVLAYVAQRSRTLPDNKEQSYTALLLLSRQTGEPLLSQETQSSGFGDNWTRVAADSMQIRAGGHEFQLTWKQAPDPAAPPQGEPVPKNPPEAPIKLQ